MQGHSKEYGEGKGHGTSHHGNLTFEARVLCTFYCTLDPAGPSTDPIQKRSENVAHLSII